MTESKGQQIASHQCSQGRPKDQGCPALKARGYILRVHGVRFDSFKTQKTA